MGEVPFGYTMHNGKLVPDYAVARGVAVDVVLKHIGVLSMLREVDGKNGKEFTMRSTFVTTAMENGASLEAVQLAAGQAYHVTTKLYDRRGYDPEKLVSFFANY
jgi:site-specific recombinase XerD